MAQTALTLGCPCTPLLFQPLPSIVPSLTISSKILPPCPRSQGCLNALSSKTLTQHTCLYPLSHQATLTISDSRAGGYMPACLCLKAPIISTGNNYLLPLNSLWRPCHLPTSRRGVHHSSSPSPSIGNKLAKARKIRKSLCTLGLKMK